MQSRIFVLCLALVVPLQADSPAAMVPLKPVIQAHYDGGFPNDFPDEFSRVQTLIPLAQLDIATQLGTASYSQGFQHPVRVRFEDGGPALAENPYFYLQRSADGVPFEQTLVVNVEAFAKASGDSNWKDDALRHALNYTMTQLIFNDIAGGDADQALPSWVQEGTAVYLSGMGQAFVEKAASEVTRSHVGELVDDLNRPLPMMNRRQYARDYLAIHYIAHAGGSGTFQALISDLLKNTSAAAAIQDVLGQDWNTFEENVKKFSTGAFAQYAREDEDPVTPSHRKS